MICISSKSAKREFELCHLPLSVAVRRNHTQEDLHNLAEKYCNWERHDSTHLHYEILTDQTACQGSTVFHSELIWKDATMWDLVMVAEMGNYYIFYN